MGCDDLRILNEGQYTLFNFYLTSRLHCNIEKEKKISHPYGA